MKAGVGWGGVVDLGLRGGYLTKISSHFLSPESGRKQKTPKKFTGEQPSISGTFGLKGEAAASKPCGTGQVCPSRVPMLALPMRPHRPS